MVSMIETTYTYPVTVKSQFEPWVIRTYLHRRSYNVLYLITKVLPIVQLSRGVLEEPLDYILMAFIFVYFELFILLRYVMIRRQVKTKYPDKTVTVHLLQDTIGFAMDDGRMDLPWTDITLVKETPWFFLIYQGRNVQALLYKRIMSEADVLNVRGYFRSQQEIKNRPVIIRN
jgi:hypothetical protein